MKDFSKTMDQGRQIKMTALSRLCHRVKVISWESIAVNSYNKMKEYKMNNLIFTT